MRAILRMGLLLFHDDGAGFLLANTDEAATNLDLHGIAEWRKAQNLQRRAWYDAERVQATLQFQVFWSDFEYYAAIASGSMG